MDNKSKVRKTIRTIWMLIFNEIRPLLEDIQNKLQSGHMNVDSDKLWNCYNLCSDQIRKCVLVIIEVFQFNKSFITHERESLECVAERLSCCHNKLLSIKKYIDKCLNQEANDCDADESIIFNTMYFVNWIDQTFEVLETLSNIVYRAGSNTSSENCEIWKNELVTCVTGIHTCIDELLLCAMTLCKYCLPADQLIVKARCQVVLRETKALLSDLITGDLDSVFHATKEALKLPVKPSNISVLIDVLKDVLYVLETNTNTALLALLVHCFAYTKSPADILKDHFMQENFTDICSEDHDNCEFVKEFDLYNERLIQIGSFAISCSSDDKRVLSLRSGLASLEALDPHLVPALMVAPESFTSKLFLNTWKSELEDIRENVFLIVDPSAFAQKAKQMLHEILLEIIREDMFDNKKTCSVINIGSVMKDFFDVYKEYEPEALPLKEKLLPLLQDLNKVQMECKLVCNMLSTDGDYIYPVKSLNNNKVTLDQLKKRLKLLHTIVGRISSLLGPNDNDEQIFEQSAVKNETHTINNNFNTYDINTPRKTVNMTRSVFGRTTNIRCSTAKFPLAILTKNLKVNKELSFSLKLDEVCNDLSAVKVRNASILYHTPLKSRASLRKAVLNRHCMKTPEDLGNNVVDRDDGLDDDFFDEEAMSLQITEVLNEINNLTVTKARQMNLTYDEIDIDADDSRRNVLKIPVNNEPPMKRVWNITVNSEVSETSQPSNVDTLERINDYNIVTSKLGDLRTEQMETSL